MSGTVPKYHWDTNLFTAWLKDERRPPGEMDGLQKVLEANARNENMIMTSSITVAEIKAGVLSTADGRKKLDRVLLRPNLLVINVDLRIASLAGEIKSYYLSHPRTISLGDAVQCATAILHDADELHTFDDRGTRTSVGLIEISGNVAGQYNLTITKPFEKQAELNLQKPAEAKK